MNTSSNRPNDREEQLQRLVDKALRDQPLRRAPSSLEANVMAALARRARVPWWRTNFSHWPIAARVMFLVASVGFVKLALQATTLLAGPFDPGVRGAELFAEVTWIHALFAAVFAAVRSLPTLWLYGGVTVIAGLYLMLFGVSAAAYRTLYASR